MLARTSRLPGISVHAKQPADAPGLPRMDVAVFAGFAERGPSHRAVAIDSVSAFAATFGGDVSIGLDRDRGIPHFANLPSSVRAFFANGGIRCWVIRIAWTKAQANSWQDTDYKAYAHANNFSITGLLLRGANDDQTSSVVSPALAQACSVGSWSDGLAIRARLGYRPMAINNPARIAHKNAAGKRRSVGISFESNDPLAIGDLIECPSIDGQTMRYAKIIRVENSKIWALWIASFKHLTTKLPEQNGTVSVIGDAEDYPAALTENRETSLRFVHTVMPTLRPGQWIKFVRQGEAIWLQAQTISGDTVAGPAWQQIASRLRGGIGQAHIVKLDLMIEHNGNRRILRDLGLTPEAENSLASLMDDDRFYAADNSATGHNPSPLTVAPLAESQELIAEAVRLFGSDDFTAEHRISLRRAWLPIGLVASWSNSSAILADPRAPSQRDGLASLDHRLFLDPRLSDLTGNQLVAAATDLRAVDDAGFFGIHAALDINGDLYNEASLLAVPDATIGAWDIDKPAVAIPFAANSKAKIVPPSWRTHQGGCIDPNDNQPLDGPDTARFLDCRIQDLQTPTLLAPNGTVTGTQFELHWGPADANALFVLEEAIEENFSAPVTVYRGKATSLTIGSRPDGFYFYRIRQERDGVSSGFSKSVLVNIRSTATQYLEQNSDSMLRLRRVHLAMLRMASATADFLAILSLPATSDAQQASDYSTQLRNLAPGYGGSLQLGQNEAHALSYGALYHPWLITGQDQRAMAPDGAIAGLMAAMARDRGCWIAPANIPIQDVDGLAPAIEYAELLPLDQAKVNIIRPVANGLITLAADTLSDMPEWRYIHVRRLMILLRRATLRAGMVYAFEPNNTITRRAVERSISFLLDDLQRRGAFAGARSEQSFRFATSTTANDRDNGRIAFEIGVAPSQPMRFLLLHLAQQGTRLTALEKVAA
jgi:hypothetical protein